LGNPRTNRVVIYTDGACKRNPGPGGWAAVILRPDRYEEIGGREDHTTNNRMELTAAIQGLRTALPGDDVRVVTDSRYLHDGISRWVDGWRRRGWRKADGGEVLNRDLWEELVELRTRPGVRVTWEHVRGHAGHALNERCDEIASAFARGKTPQLRAGAADRGQSPEPAALISRGIGYPLYASLVDGGLRVHRSWPECERRVKGVKGARHKKVRTPEELRATLEGWGIAAGSAEGLLGGTR
jgi:ribonuclease HI